MQLDENILGTHSNFRQYLPDRILNSMFLSPVTPEEFENLVNSSDSTSAGYDDISMNIIKFVIDLISHVLVCIFNNSFQSGVFSDALKIAKLVPIHKKYNKHLIENYRSIAMLSSFSKLI